MIIRFTWAVTALIWKKSCLSSTNFSFPIIFILAIKKIIEIYLFRNRMKEVEKVQINLINEKILSEVRKFKEIF